jgi:cholesterol transport system auxiliary component
MKLLFNRAARVSKRLLTLRVINRNPLPACAALLLALGAFLLTGCLSKRPLNKQSFTFTIPEANPHATVTNAPVLTIRQITVMPPFDSPSLTYRTGDFSYERDPYAGFLVSPAESLSEPIRALLRNTGKFSAVADPESSLHGTLDLEISVTQLYGDFRDKEHPTADLEMHFVLYRVPESRGARLVKPTPVLLLQKIYSRRVPLKSRTAADVVAGLNDALYQIVVEFAHAAPTR